MEHFDKLGNPLKEGQIVLVLVPHTEATFRKAIVRGFKDERQRYCNVQVEYINDRLYSNMPHFYMTDKNGEVPGIKFSSKTTKAWRFCTDIIAFNEKYINN